MTKITAAEARALSGLTVEEHVSEVYPLIREAAEKKLRNVNLHGPFWAHDGYLGTHEWQKAKKILENDGFKVEFFYTEHQFVDMYTIVEW